MLARPTLAFIGGVAIGLVVFEIAEYVDVIFEDWQWVRAQPGKTAERVRQQAGRPFHKAFVPNGRLGLLAYSPYGWGKWERRWESAKGAELKKSIAEIVEALERAAPDIASETADAKRKAEEEHRAYEAKLRAERREELAKMKLKAAAESRENLLEVIEGWVTASNIEQFFADLSKAASLPDDQRAQVEQRIQEARSLFGGTDALEHFRAWRTPSQFYEAAKKGLWWKPDDLE